MKKNKADIITQPNTSLNNKTGSWRTQKPMTNQNICVGCSLCAKICPEACIDMAETNLPALAKTVLRPKTNYDYCKGCALCAHECPVKAINMENDY